MATFSTQRSFPNSTTITTRLVQNVLTQLSENSQCLVWTMYQGKFQILAARWFYRQYLSLTDKSVHYECRPVGPVVWFSLRVREVPGSTTGQAHLILFWQWRHYLTNRVHVAVRLFSNRSQMTSKCDKNGEAIAECVTDVLTTLWRLMNTHTAAWNLFVLYNKKETNHYR